MSLNYCFDIDFRCFKVPKYKRKSIFDILIRKEFSQKKTSQGKNPPTNKQAKKMLYAMPDICTTRT